MIMGRAGITWTAIWLCAFWIAWLIFDSYFNSGLRVFNGSDSGGHTWLITWRRLEVTLVEIAATSLAALVLSVLASRDRR